MKLRLGLIALSLTLALAAVAGSVTPTAAAATTTAETSAFSVPISGTFTDSLGGIGTLTGTYTVTAFTTQNGALVAVGDLTATLTDSAGNVVGTTTTTLTATVGILTASCQLLHLELGPLDLELLGMPVHLNTIVIDISASSLGFLGSLLCSITSLLGIVDTTVLSPLLNQLLLLQ
jgi:hypothetical protein